MMSPGDTAKLEGYARKLRWALGALPEIDRDGIVAEMRSHVLDRVDSGANVEAALSALGEPYEYARAFRDSYTVASALSSQRTPLLVGALAQGAVRSAATTAAFLVILLAWAVAALVVYTAILKISDPSHVGLWLGGRFFFIGIIDDPSTGRELLGPWITPVALLFVVGAWGVTRSLAVWALKRRAPST